MAEEPIKVGIISCAGEDIPEGTISRLAVRRVMELLRPGQAVTICLPLFLAGNEGERDFARNFPTITVDGCDKRCAQWGTETHSGPVCAALVVTDLLEEGPALSGARSHHSLSDGDRAAVELVAARIARELDQAVAAATSADAGPVAASCGCGCATSLPAGELRLDGRCVSIAGLPLIFQQCRTDGLASDDPNLGHRLLEAVRVYYPVPAEEEAAYQAALIAAYRASSPVAGATSGGASPLLASDSKGAHSR